MRHSSVVCRVSAALTTLLLLTILPSCGSVDEFMEHAEDVAKDVGQVLDDVVDDAKERLPEGASDSGSPTTSRPPRPSGAIATGPSTVVSSQVVEPSGGTLKVERPGDPLDGLELDVPAGSYADVRQFNISHATVTNHSFGEFFNPATPLIIVENGGQYADEFMTMRIPVDIPPDHFAMAFYYDDEKGTLEGIPFASIDDDSITIVTRHFCELLVSIINNSLLDDLIDTDIDSHFRPGIDDWQFKNYGSTIAPEGHCAGQALSALWYFCEQPDGVDRTLYGRYDRNGNDPPTPDLWQDDSYGYRLASTVQVDSDWRSWGAKLQSSLRGKNDSFQFKAFAYSILLSHEPQCVDISSSTGSRHAMVVYRVFKDNLYIADPNYPGDTGRRIEFASGAFKPYHSGPNAAAIAAGQGIAFESIGYMAKSSVVEWKRIGERWVEFKAGTIGNDRFLPYTTYACLDNCMRQEPLVNGYVSGERTLQAMVIGSSFYVKIGQVYRNGVAMGIEAAQIVEVELGDGDNLLGLVLTDGPGKYVDFQYVNVQYGEVDCRGWVLDSVTTRDAYMTQENEGWQDLKFSSGDGRFSSSGRYRLYDSDIASTDDDLFATTSCSGTWTPLPACIEPDKPVSIRMQLGSSVVYDQMEDYHWSPQFDLVINGSLTKEVAFHQRLDHSTPTAQQSDEAIITLFEGSQNWNETEIVIQIGTPEGSIDYVYTYVWRG